MKRKIAAILAADVVGYTRMVREDEEDTLRQLDDCRVIFSDFITRFGGRIVDTAGDSVLAEFPTAIDAVRCAIDTQESLRTRNLAYPEGRQMNFRIGITMGDVLERDGFLLGDGINIASRLQALAPPGGICISRSVYEAAAHKISLKFADVGQQQLKNIPDTVHAYTADLGPEVTQSKPPPHGGSFLRPVWGALAIPIVFALGAAAYLSFVHGPDQVETPRPPAVAAQPRPDADKETCAASYADEAVAACTRLLERGEADPTSRAAYLGNRGAARINRGDYEPALKDIDESLALEPNNARVLRSRAEILLKSDKLDEALGDIERALSIDPDYAAAVATRGAINEALGHKDIAIADFRRALAIDGTIEGAKAGLARLESVGEATPW